MKRPNSLGLLGPLFLTASHQPLPQAAIDSLYIPGHISVGYLMVAGPAMAIRRPLKMNAVLLPVIIGTLTPDIIDKSIQAVELSPYGRTVGHSLYVLTILALFWKWADLRRARWSRWFGWWIAGWASHIGADLVNDLVRGLEHTGYLFAAWFGWPYTNPDMWQQQIEIADPCQLCYSSLEVAVLMLALLVGWGTHLQFRRGVFELTGGGK